MKGYPHIVQFRTDDGVLHDLPPSEPKQSHYRNHLNAEAPRGPAYKAVVHDLTAYDKLMKSFGGSIIGISAPVGEH